MSGIALQDCGPCLTGSARVVDHLPVYLSPAARQVITVRLSHGEALYGQPLRLGWGPAPIEAVQEAADLVAYLVSAGAPEGITRDASALLEGVLRWQARAGQSL